MMRALFGLLRACLFAGTAVADTPADRRADVSFADYRATAERIIVATRAGNRAYAKLEELCDDIGHRLSGSDELERAIDWAVQKLKEDGHENVRKEPVMVPRWVRGRESLDMIEPRAHPMPLLGLGGSVGTPPDGITAEVIVVADENELDAAGDAVQGKIVLFNNPMPEYDPEKGSGYGTTVRFRGRGAHLAANKGAVACLVRSVTARSLQSPHTGAMRYGDAHKKIPAAAITTEDASMLARLTARGKRVVVRLKMEARDEGQAPSANVIGELRGRTHPDEIVVIGGHSDAWDVGQGAHDDGAGCVIAMEAISVLRRMGLIPRRTIRVVLWTNEENGLAGGRQYANDHASELPNHVAAIESDSGAFRPEGFTLEHKDPQRQQVVLAQMRELVHLLEPIGPMKASAGGSGADIGPMKSAGVPLMGLEVEGSTYFDYHHSPADTLDKVDPQHLTDCVATMAVTAYILADMPARLGESAEAPTRGSD